MRLHRKPVLFAVAALILLTAFTGAAGKRDESVHEDTGAIRKDTETAPQAPGAAGPDTASPPPNQLVSSLVLPGVAPVPAKLSQGTRGGSFIRADIEELDTLNPVTTRSRSVFAVLGLVFEGLLTRNPVTGRVQGGVAAGYRVTEGGHSLLFDLNRNVHFSDGEPCTADDVLFSFEEIYMNPDVDTRRNEVLKLRDSLITFHKVDRYTVRMDLPAPFRPVLSALTSLPVLPAHILRPQLETRGIEWFNSAWGNGDNLDMLAGTGPYRLAEYQPGESLRLVRSPYYLQREGVLKVEGAPYLDEIIELLNLDRDTRLLMFQIGELDFYAANDLDISRENMNSLIQNSDEGGYRLLAGGQSLRSNHFVSFNLNPEAVDEQRGRVFRDLRFRQAVSALVDRERVLRQVYLGYGYLEGSPERDVSPFHLDLPPDRFDPVRAGELLDAIGLIDRDGDGFRDLPSGKPFGFTLLTNRENPLRVDIGELITGQLTEAGLNVRLEQLPYDDLVTKLMVSFEWEAVLLGTEGRIEPNNSSALWESKGTLHLWHPYQEKPATRWELRLDQLFAMGRITWEFDKAVRWYHEYQRIVAEQLPVIQVLTPAEIFGCREGFGNMIFHPVTYNALGMMPYVYRIRD
jgi:peptide/nickel transport system substrate-binding protein